MMHILAFLKIVDKGSFSAAAKELHLTQPTVSARIKQLENELNTPLFIRTTGKSTLLTPSAKKLLPYLEEAYHLVQKGTEVVKKSKLDKINISCPHHMGSEILPELLKVLYNHFPQIDFPITIKENDRIIDELLQKKVDIGFVYMENLHSSTDLNIIKITNLDNVLVCSPEHPLSKQEDILIEKLQNEKVIVYNKQFFPFQNIEQFLLNHGLTNYQTIEVENLGWIKMMVRKGLGLSFLQRSIVREELESGKLSEISLVNSLPTTPIYLITQSIIPEEVTSLIIKTASNLFNTAK